MLNRKKNNNGMSLIEVIVSMLVLSIAAVSVLMAFNVTAKVNTKAKSKQSVESLMENLIEYAEAGGTSFEEKFTHDAVATPAVTGSVTTEELKGVKQGFYKYDVKISTDTNPSDYDKAGLNQKGVIRFGGSNNTILVDASSRSNTLNDYDGSAYKYFELLHTEAVEAHNLEEEQENELTGDPVQSWDVKTLDEIKAKIDRELLFETVVPEANKMQLKVYFSYRIDDSFHEWDASESREYRVPLYVSEEYDATFSTEAEPNTLDQIYVLYSPCQEETADVTINKTDIRFLDENKTLDVVFYIVNQEESTVALNTAVDSSWMNRAEQNDEIRISFTSAGAQMTPQSMEILCSAKVKYVDGAPAGGVSKEDHTLLAKEQEVRVVTVTMEIIDPQTGAVLSSEKITRLQ